MPTDVEKFYGIEMNKRLYNDARRYCSGIFVSRNNNNNNVIKYVVVVHRSVR